MNPNSALSAWQLTVMAVVPASFLVGSQNTLLDGEAARARRWGMTLGAVSKTHLPVPARRSQKAR